MSPKEVVQKEFKIKEFESPNGIKKRKSILKTTKIVSSNILKILTSSLSKREKAKRIQNILQNFTYMSAMGGLWQTFSKSSFQIPSALDILKGEDINFIDIGPTFWLKVAAILLIIKIIHKIISSGVIFIKDIKTTWQKIKNLFKENIVNEGFISYYEYKFLL